MNKAVLLKRMPEELMRQTKAAAALRGITLREFAITAFERAVNESPRPRAEVRAPKPRQKSASPRARVK